MRGTLSIWVYLAQTPLLWLTVTILAWLAADRLAQMAGRHPAVNPVVISIVVVGGILTVTATPYETYFAGAQFVHFLLGPAIVAIAVQLVLNRAAVRANLLPLLAALVVGSVVSVLAVMLLGPLVGLPADIVVALVPKSVTAPVAMGVSEQLGGDPSLTAVLVVLTGVTGAIIITPLMNLLRITDYAGRGFAAGLAAHGIGTARAFVVDPVAGTFAGIAMGLNAVVTSVVAPVLVGWWG